MTNQQLWILIAGLCGGGFALALLERWKAARTKSEGINESRMHGLALGGALLCTVLALYQAGVFGG